MITVTQGGNAVKHSGSRIRENSVVSHHRPMSHDFGYNVYTRLLPRQKMLNGVG